MLNLSRSQAMPLLASILIFQFQWQSCTEKPSQDDNVEIETKPESPQTSADSSDESAQSQKNDNGNAANAPVDVPSLRISESASTAMKPNYDMSTIDKSDLLFSLKKTSQLVSYRLANATATESQLNKDILAKSQALHELNVTAIHLSNNLKGLDVDLDNLRRDRDKKRHELNQFQIAMSTSDQKIKSLQASVKPDLEAWNKTPPQIRNLMSSTYKKIKKRIDTMDSQISMEIQSYRYSSAAATERKDQILSLDSRIASLNEMAHISHVKQKHASAEISVGNQELKIFEEKRSYVSEVIASENLSLSELVARESEAHAGLLTDDVSLSKLDGFWKSDKFVTQYGDCQTLIAVRSKGRSMIRVTSCNSKILQYDTFAVTDSKVGHRYTDQWKRSISLALVSSSCPTKITSTWTPNPIMYLVTNSNYDGMPLSAPTAGKQVQAEFSESAPAFPKTCEELFASESVGEGDVDSNMDFLARSACFERQNTYQGCLSL